MAMGGELNRARVGSLILLLVLGPVLGACGFQPLYAQGPDRRGVSADLALIYIEPISERIGHQLYNLLLDQLNPKGRPVRPSFHLEVTLKENKTGLAVKADDTVSRYNLALQASFVLKSARIFNDLIFTSFGSTHLHLFLDRLEEERVQQ